MADLIFSCLPNIKYKHLLIYIEFRSLGLSVIYLMRHGIINYVSKPLCLQQKYYNSGVEDGIFK